MSTKYGVLQDDMDDLDLDLADGERSSDSQTKLSSLARHDDRPVWMKRCNCGKCKSCKDPKNTQ